MQTRRQVSGQRLAIDFAVSSDGSSPVQEAFDSLSASDQRVFHVAFQRLADEGRISSRQRFKRIEGSDLWEFKKHQHRFLGGYLPDKRFVVVAYEKKQQERLSPPVVTRAEQLFAQYERAVQKALKQREVKR